MVKSNRATGGESMSETDRLKQIKVLAKFKNAIGSKKKDEEIFNELLGDGSYHDPTPDLVEGIFYLDKSNFLDRCFTKAATGEDNVEH